MWRYLLYSLAVLASLLPVGCGGAKPVKSKYRIAVIPKGLTHEFWQSIKRGADRAASDLLTQGIPIEILWDGPRKESDSQEQISLVTQMGSRGISGLVLAPQDSKAMVPCVKQTVERDISVVIIDSDLADSSLYVKYVATNNYNGGRMAAKQLLKVMEQRGKKAPSLVLFRYQVGSESTEQREKGFLDEIAEENKKRQTNKIQIISDNVYAGATVDSAQKEAGPLVGRIKDKADGIFAVNESAATGMLNELRSQKVNKKIALVAFDSSEPLLQAVEDGDVEGLIVQDPYRMGYLGVWILVQHLEGVDVGKGDKNLYTGEYLLTKDNLAAKSTRERFDSVLQKKRTIDLPELTGKK